MEWLLLLIPLIIAIIADDLYIRHRFSNLFKPDGDLVVTKDDPPLLYLNFYDEINFKDVEECTFKVVFEEDIAE